MAVKMGFSGTVTRVVLHFCMLHVLSFRVLCILFTFHPMVVPSTAQYYIYKTNKWLQGLGSILTGEIFFLENCSNSAVNKNKSPQYHVILNKMISKRWGSNLTYPKISPNKILFPAHHSHGKTKKPSNFVQLLGDISASGAATTHLGSPFGGSTAAAV